jgi:hypothetical protein
MHCPSKDTIKKINDKSRKDSICNSYIFFWQVLARIYFSITGYNRENGTKGETVPAPMQELEVRRCNLHI